MILLEWSDTRVKFKIKEIENNLASDLDLWYFTKYLLEIMFSDDTVKEIIWTVDTDNNLLVFDIFWEDTKDKEWSFTADIRWIKGVKKVRFNPTTIKWKVLNSVTVPNEL